MIINQFCIRLLQEWMEASNDRQTKSYHTYKKAYDSMKACPLDLYHPSEAMQLQGIGPILCSRMEKALRLHCESNGIPLLEKPTLKMAGAHERETAIEQRPTKRRCLTKPYVPAYRSGPYSILLAFTDVSARELMPKSDIVRLARAHCDSSFDLGTDRQKYYTAWNSMTTLISKGYAYKNGNPPKYGLTEDGIEVAYRMIAANRPDCSAQSIVPCPAGSPKENSDVVLLGEDSQTPPSTSELMKFLANPGPGHIIPPGSFEVQMRIDNREVKTQKDRDFIQEQLYNSGIALNTRVLNVGDVLWVAKCPDGREIVLDYIVERKRMDDLVGSIKDGRFHEQKFRLLRSGCRHVIYIIEDTNFDNVKRYLDAIQSAISSTQVVNGIFVKRVPSLDGTVKYLARLTKRLAQIYENQGLIVLPDYLVDSRTFAPTITEFTRDQPSKRFHLSFEAFTGLTRKSGNLHAGDLWLKMLMTIRGVSAEKALEIQSRYPSMTHLIEAYDKCDDVSAQEQMLADRCQGYGRKAIGRALSCKVSRIFCREPS